MLIMERHTRHGSTVKWFVRRMYDSVSVKWIKVHVILFAYRDGSMSIEAYDDTEDGIQMAYDMYKCLK